MTEFSYLLKGLVISEPWYDLILSGKKSWEMRSRITHYRGPLAVIRKGSGMVGGIIDVVDCIPDQREAEYEASEPCHCIPPERHKQFAAQYPVAWVITNARRLSKPVPYSHKKGAQSRVVLSVDETSAVRNHDPLDLGEGGIKPFSAPANAMVPS